MNNHGMLNNTIMSKTVFTGLCGMGLLVTAPFIGGTLGISTFFLSMIGIALIGFVIPEVYFSVTGTIEDQSAKFIIVKDILLITTCFVTIAFNIAGLSVATLALTGMFSAVFAALTYMQHSTLRQKIEMETVEHAPELKVVYIDAA